MKAPNQEQGVVWDTPMSALDVLPTMAEMIGIEVPWDTEGQSVLQHPREVARIQSQTGELVALSRSDLLAAVAFVRARFPHLDSQFDIYSYDGYTDLLGQRLSDLIVEPSSTVATLSEPDSYDTINLASGRVPAFVSGSISGMDDAAATNVAVLVNDVVVAVVPVHDIVGSEAQFGAVVPLSFFVDGANSVRVLLVTGDPSNPTLTESVFSNTDSR
jgi:hypothetical protein